MIFVPFVTKLKQPQKFFSPSNPESIGYILYMSPSFSTVFISLHKMTRWWQNYLGLHDANVAWAYWLFALYISQPIYRQRPRALSVRSVLSDSSFRDLPLECNRDIIILYADQICFSPNTSHMARCWGVPINVICTNVLKEELNLLMIHSTVCLFQFFLYSHKIRTIVTI